MVRLFHALGCEALCALDRLRLPAERAGELSRVRRGLHRARGERPGEAQMRLAQEILALKLELAEATGEVRACSGCGRKHPEPHGRWAGGFCCGGSTQGVFDGPESAALAAIGAGPASLPAISGETAGCVFRGPRGCALPVGLRPTICVSYICRELAAELHALGRRERVDDLADRLAAAFGRFSREREAQLADEALRGGEL